MHISFQSLSPYRGVKQLTGCGEHFQCFYANNQMEDIIFVAKILHNQKKLSIQQLLSETMEAVHAKSAVDEALIKKYN